jgi:hypothetical protein
MSATSCVPQHDHQTCRGSSIGRACGSYHLMIHPTSRSRVRAPPSAIPTPLLSFFFAVCSGGRKLIFCTISNLMKILKPGCLPRFLQIDARTGFYLPRPQQLFSHLVVELRQLLFFLLCAHALNSSSIWTENHAVFRDLTSSYVSMIGSWNTRSSLSESTDERSAIRFSGAVSGRRYMPEWQLLHKNTI